MAKRVSLFSDCFQFAFVVKEQIDCIAYLDIIWETYFYGSKNPFAFFTVYIFVWERNIEICSFDMISGLTGKA